MLDRIDGYLAGRLALNAQDREGRFVGAGGRCNRQCGGCPPTASERGEAGILPGCGNSL